MKSVQEFINDTDGQQAGAGGKTETTLPDRFHQKRMEARGAGEPPLECAIQTAMDREGGIAPRKSAPCPGHKGIDRQGRARWRSVGEIPAGDTRLKAAIAALAAE